MEQHAEFVQCLEEAAAAIRANREVDLGALNTRMLLYAQMRTARRFVPNEVLANICRVAFGGCLRQVAQNASRMCAFVGAAHWKDVMRLWSGIDALECLALLRRATRRMRELRGLPALEMENAYVLCMKGAHACEEADDPQLGWVLVIAEPSTMKVDTAMFQSDASIRTLAGKCDFALHASLPLSKMATREIRHGWTTIGIRFDDKYRPIHTVSLLPEWVAGVHEWRRMTVTAEGAEEEAM